MDHQQSEPQQQGGKCNEKVSTQIHKYTSDKTGHITTAQVRAIGRHTLKLQPEVIFGRVPLLKVPDFDIYGVCARIWQ